MGGRYRYFPSTKHSHFGNITCSEFTIANSKCPNFDLVTFTRFSFPFHSIPFASVRFHSFRNTTTNTRESEWNVKSYEWILICVIWYLEISSRIEHNCILVTRRMACAFNLGQQFSFMVLSWEFRCKINVRSFSRSRSFTLSFALRFGT